MNKALKLGFVHIFLFYLTSLYSQEIVSEVSYDTVYLGNYIGVKYTMYNWEGELTSIDFGEFDRLSGPNTSTSVSISGQNRRSIRSYSFILNPPDKPGVYTLPKQSLTLGEEERWTEELTIVVLENPENIAQNPNQFARQSSRFGFDELPAQPKPPIRGKRQKF